MFKKVLVWLLALATVLSLCACNKAEPDDETQDPSANVEPTEETTDDVTEAPTDDATEEPTTDATEETEDATTETEEETEEPTADATETTSSTTSTTKPANTTATEATEPDTSGTASDPISCYPDGGEQDSFTVTLTEIAGGSSVYYNVYRIGGMVITLEDSKAYIIYNGTKYTPSNGKITFTAEATEADKPTTIEVGNTSSSKKTYTLKCEAITGSYEKPKTVSKVNTSYSITVGGNDQGYYYQFTATQDGTLKISMTSSSNSNATVVIVATNQSNSAQRSNDEDCDGVYDDYTVIEDVKKGDVIQIVFSTLLVRSDRKNPYPTSDITWELSYE